MIWEMLTRVNSSVFSSGEYILRNLHMLAVKSYVIPFGFGSFSVFRYTFS